MPEPSPERTRLVVTELQELADAPPSSSSPQVFTSLVARGRARRARRRWVTAAGVAAVAVSVAAVTWQVRAFAPVKGSAPAVRPTGVSTPALDSWTQEPAPPWTPTSPSPSVSGFQPTPDPTWTPVPSPPPSEVPQPGDVPAVVVPRSAALARADVPRPLVLWEDSGPILQLARVIPTLELCESATTGTEKLGAAPIGGRTWRWAVAREYDNRQLVHTVTAFAAGTGHARFEDVRRLAAPCHGSDTDPTIFSMTSSDEEAFILSATLHDDVPGGQYAVGVARVGDVLVGVQLKLTGTREYAVSLMKTLLKDALGHLATAGSMHATASTSR